MKKHPETEYTVGSRRYAVGDTFRVSHYTPLIVVALLWLLLGAAAPAAAANKSTPFDPAGLTILLASTPSTTPATTVIAPAPALASDGLTLDHFVLGFGLVVIGVLGAALAMRALRSVRASVTTSQTNQKSPPPK